MRAGDGTKGPRWDDWRWLPLAAPCQPHWRRWLLVRRSRSDPTERTAYVVCAPETTALATVVQVVGRRWTIEPCFEEAKGEVGLDQYEVRSWTGWYRPITLAMWAYALLTVLRAVHLPVAPPVKKMPEGVTPSRPQACQASRRLEYRSVSARFGISSGGSCWLRSSARSVCSLGRLGAAGTKGSRNIGTINDVQLYNYNCSTSTRPGVARSGLRLVTP